MKSSATTPDLATTPSKDFMDPVPFGTRQLPGFHTVGWGELPLQTDAEQEADRWMEDNIHVHTVYDKKTSHRICLRYFPVIK